MFTLTDTPVKFVGLLILFSFCVLWSLYQLARRQTGPTLVSNCAHLAMSAVMLLMVPRTLWQPFSAAIPLPALVGFFGALVLWFVYLGVRGFAARDVPRIHGWHALGHAAMFGAMTWHLAGMLVRMRASMAGSMDHATPGAGPMDHSATAQNPMGQTPMHHNGMDHGTMVAPASELAMPMQGSSTAWIVAVVGLPLMTYLLIAALVNLKNVMAPGRSLLDHAGHEAAGHGQYAGSPRLAAMSDFAMNFGMFWMSTGLMVPLLPFFGAFAF